MPAEEPLYLDQVGRIICDDNKDKWMLLGRCLRNLERNGDIRINYEQGKIKSFFLTLKGDAIADIRLERFAGGRGINRNAEGYQLAQLSMLLTAYGYFGKPRRNPKQELLEIIDYSVDDSVPTKIAQDFQRFREEVISKSNHECRVMLRCLEASDEAENFKDAVRRVKSKMPRAKKVGETMSYLLQEDLIGFDG